MNTSLTKTPACLACLTPAGTGAIATLALRGPAAWDLVQELFQPLAGKKSAAAFWEGVRQSPQPGQFWPGRLGDPALDMADEVVLALKSVSPEPWFEIHCHGGRQVIALLEELFSARGVQMCSWPDFLRLARTEPLEVAAQQALAEASTVRTAAILLDQYHGAFRNAVLNILDHLQNSQCQQAADQLQEVARWVPLGKHLTRPWRVAIAGAPNVGKSSLLNRLAGFQRCVVSPLPGTTRDVVTARLAVDGWPVEFMDTAGVHDEAETLEQQGIELAIAAAAEADLCLWLLDASAPPVLPPRDLPLRLVINKIDLPSAWDLGQFSPALRLSAETGAGMDELQQALSSWLVPEVPAPGAAVPFDQQLGQVIEEAWNRCGQERWEETKGLLYNLLQGK